MAGERRRNELQRLAEAERARDTAQAEAKVGKLALEELRKIQGEIVAQAFEPLLKPANRFASRILRAPLAYDAQRAALGMWRDGQWVGSPTFSGIEELVTFAAIQAALSARAPVRIMMLDEMARATGANFDHLIAAVKDAVASGLVDQFVGIIPGNPADFQHLAEKDCSVVAVA